MSTILPVFGTTRLTHVPGDAYSSGLAPTVTALRDAPCCRARASRHLQVCDGWSGEFDLIGWWRKPRNSLAQNESCRYVVDERKRDNMDSDVVINYVLSSCRRCSEPRWFLESCSGNIFKTNVYVLPGRCHGHSDTGGGFLAEPTCGGNVERMGGRNAGIKEKTERPMAHTSRSRT
ncbi:uncharacterized protein [Dermacentor albipictus]|uniref:uncharacterized protein n=1 Tax=Dermacentor albipictus TaxID=60249 RepID=UPI0038FC68AD